MTVEADVYATTVRNRVNFGRRHARPASSSRAESDHLSGFFSKWHHPFFILGFVFTNHAPLIFHLKFPIRKVPPISHFANLFSWDTLSVMSRTLFVLLKRFTPLSTTLHLFPLPLHLSYKARNRAFCFSFFPPFFSLLL